MIFNANLFFQTKGLIKRKHWIFCNVWTYFQIRGGKTRNDSLFLKCKELQLRLASIGCSLSLPLTHTFTLRSHWWLISPWKCGYRWVRGCVCESMMCTQPQWDWSVHLTSLWSAVALWLCCRCSNSLFGWPENAEMRLARMHISKQVGTFVS